MVVFRHKEFKGSPQAKIPRKNFYWAIRDHKFNLSPPGNARDCFRTWEVCLPHTGHQSHLMAKGGQAGCFIRSVRCSVVVHPY